MDRVSMLLTIPLVRTIVHVNLRDDVDTERHLGTNQDHPRSGGIILKASVTSSGAGMLMKSVVTPGPISLMAGVVMISYSVVLAMTFLLVVTGTTQFMVAPVITGFITLSPIVAWKWICLKASLMEKPLIVVEQTSCNLLRMSRVPAIMIHLRAGNSAESRKAWTVMIN